MELALGAAVTSADDAAEFRGWVTPHLVAMTGLASRLTSPADRDDVVQEALVRAWRKRQVYDEARGTPRAWLLAIVADRARRHRVRAPRPVHELIDIADRSIDLDRSRDLDRSIDLDRAVAGLPRRQRLAVELHYLLGLSVQECSQVMACSEGTVKSTLHDARQRLRRDLEEAERDG